MSPEIRQVSTCTIPANLDQVAGVRRAFADFLAGHGISEGGRRNWELVMTEALTNAILHGSPKGKQALIQVNWWLEPGDCTVRLTVIDSGRGPVRQRVMSPVLPDNTTTTGRGLYLIRRQCDGVTPRWGIDGFQLELSQRHPEMARNRTLDPEMVALINELAGCYESLSSFHRLGQTLVRMERLETFVESNLEDTRRAYRVDGIVLVLKPDLEPPLIRLTEDSTNAILGTHGQASLIADECAPRERYWSAASPISGLPVAVSTCQQGVIIPIQTSDAFYGVLLAGRKIAEAEFLAPELNHLRTLADIFALTFTRAVLLAQRDVQQQSLRELQIAAELQNQLLPITTPPVHPAIATTIHRDTAREVAGDYAEARIDPQGRLLVAVIDVMGKGVSAAMLAIIFRTALDAAMDVESCLGGIMRRLNEAICRKLGPLTMFVTATLIRFANDGRTLEHCNAGHCPTLILSRGSAPVRTLEPSAAPVGVFVDTSYTTDTARLDPGDVVVVLTDGCFEWQTTAHIYGWEAIVHLFQKTCEAHGPKALWRACREEMTRHGKETVDDLEDDLTLVCCEVLP